MQRARISTAILAAALLPAGALLLFPAPADAPSEYVDARVCAACHRQIAADYGQTGMGRSFFRPAAANTTEDYNNNRYYHALSDTHFAMIRRDGQYFQRRWQIGFAGREVNVEELRVDYVLGSGNHARSYLHRTAAGTLIELPLGWYPKESWRMSPGSDNTHPRTRRFAGYKCIFCHNGYPRIPAGHDAPGADPVFTGDLPEGIDCQRCHGPGGRHVRTAATAGATAADIRASIVNPARLSATRQMEVCMQCHLETSSGRIPSAVVRFDRGPFSYVPGEPLGDFMIAFDHAPGAGHDDKFEAVSSVYRLRQSRCFRESEGRLTCQTCHNPHRVPRGEDAKSHYAAVCRQCHDPRQLAAGHPTATDCTTCHMPARRAQDTPRMIMTDHLIQRRPAGDLLAELPEPTGEEYRGEVVAYYPSPLADALYRAVAQVGLRNNLEAGLPQLMREIERQKPRHPEFYIMLGDALRASGRPREAVAVYEQAVLLNADPRGLRALAAAFEESGNPARSAESLRKAVELKPGDAESWYRYGLLDATAGRTTDAIDKIAKAIALDPSLPEKSRKLAELLAKSGQATRAQAAVKDALRIDPYDEDAWDLAGRLLMEKGETAEAIFHFERAVQLRPGSAPHLFDYALALARAGRYEEALRRAQDAAGFAPAQALVSRLHLRLGQTLADRARAIGHLREAAKSSDPAIAQEAVRALQQRGVQ